MVFSDAEVGQGHKRPVRHSGIAGRKTLTFAVHSQHASTPLAWQSSHAGGLDEMVEAVCNNDLSFRSLKSRSWSTRFTPIMHLKQGVEVWVAISFTLLHHPKKNCVWLAKIRRWLFLASGTSSTLSAICWSPAQLRTLYGSHQSVVQLKVISAPWLRHSPHFHSLFRSLLFYLCGAFLLCMFSQHTACVPKSPAGYKGQVYSVKVSASKGIPM